MNLFSGDVFQKKEIISEIIQSCENSFGPLFMVINCAGFAKAKRFEDLSEDEVKVRTIMGCI